MDAYYQLIEENRTRLEDYFAGTVSRTQNKMDAEQFMIDNIRKVTAKTYFPFIIVDNLSGAFVGYMDLKNITWHIPKAELGCFFDEKYAGKGLATQALQIFTDYCFNELGIKKLLLRTHESNLPARRIAEKCGFEVEGLIRCDHKTTAGKIVDLLYYGKVTEA
jgi:RimJ/RimL family protein N-acetyltransferase